MPYGKTQKEAKERVRMKRAIRRSGQRIRKDATTAEIRAKYRKLPKHKSRKIGKKRYRVVSTWHKGHKRNAKRVANNWRKKGYNARVVQGYNQGWEVAVRRK